MPYGVDLCDAVGPQFVYADDTVRCVSCVDGELGVPLTIVVRQYDGVGTAIVETKLLGLSMCVSNEAGIVR